MTPDAVRRGVKNGRARTEAAVMPGCIVDHDRLPKSVREVFHLRPNSHHLIITLRRQLQPDVG